MSIDLLVLAADSLGPLLEEVVFVGGATVTPWITDPGAPPVRPTKDVDVVVEVATRSAFHDFEARLRQRRFAEAQEDGIICRWRHPTGLILDAMPTDASMLGFENRWQSAAVPHAIARELPSGEVIRAVSPPFLIATKLEAFAGRGERDFIGSRDFADIIALVDGREELVGEVAAAPADVCAYISQRLADLHTDAGFLEGVYGGAPARRRKPSSRRGHRSPPPERTAAPTRVGVIDPPDGASLSARARERNAGRCAPPAAGKTRKPPGGRGLPKDRR